MILDLFGLGSVGFGWVRLGSVGFGWVRLGSVRLLTERFFAKPVPACQKLALSLY